MKTHRTTEEEMEGPISFWGYKEQESNLILPEHDDDELIYCQRDYFWKSWKSHGDGKVPYWHLPGRPEEQNENIIITSHLSPRYKRTISNIGVTLHMWNCHDGKKYPYLLVGIFRSRQLLDGGARNHQKMGRSLRTDIIEGYALQK